MSEIICCYNLVDCAKNTGLIEGYIIGYIIVLCVIIILIIIEMVELCIEDRNQEKKYN